MAARLDDLEGMPIGTLFDLVMREGACMRSDLTALVVAHPELAARLDAIRAELEGPDDGTCREVAWSAPEQGVWIRAEPDSGGRC